MALCSISNIKTSEYTLENNKRHRITDRRCGTKQRLFQKTAYYKKAGRHKMRDPSHARAQDLIKRPK